MQTLQISRPSAMENGSVTTECRSVVGLLHDKKIPKKVRQVLQSGGVAKKNILVLLCPLWILAHTIYRCGIMMIEGRKDG